MADDTTDGEYNHQNHNGSDDEMTDEQHRDALWGIYEELDKRVGSVCSSNITPQDYASTDRFLGELRVLINQIPLHI